MNDEQIENEIQAKGLTAPRVTPQRIEDVIASEHYFTADQGFRMAQMEATARNPSGDPLSDEARVPRELSLLTLCVLVLRNGFTVTGESACASPENFDAELGRKIARQHAVSKIWPLEGYLLRQSLADA